MKIQFSKNFKVLGAVAVLAFVLFSAHDWYWTLYSWVHPDVTRRYAEQFENLSDEQLDRIMKEWTSPRTDGASQVWGMRHPIDKPFVPWTNTTAVK